MSHYYREHSFHKKSRFLKRFRIFAAICLLLIISAAVFLITDSILSKRRNSVPSKPTTETKSVVVSSIDIFKTQYFQFQASKNWIFVTNESTPTKFVYRYLKNTLVQHDLTIFVNDTGTKKSASRMLLVKQSDGSLQSIQLSDNCKALVPANNIGRVQQVAIAGATFACNPDTTEYSILAGISGQDAASLQLNKPDGTQAAYSILYRNLTANPDARQMYDIIDSFQVR